MEKRLNQLTNELQKKDRTIKQLNDMLPWKQQGKGGHSNTHNNKEGGEGYLCSLSDDEFIV